MKNVIRLCILFLFVMLIILLTSCSFMPREKQIEVVTKQIEKPKLNIEQVEPLDLKPVKWIVVTKENAEQIFTNLENEGKFGENVYSSWIGPVGGRGNWAISLRNLEGLMSGQYSSWVDNIETLNYVENLDDIIIKSVKEAVSELENELGYSSVNWWWGRSHKLTFRHSIGNEIKILDRIFNFNIAIVSKKSAYI